MRRKFLKDYVSNETGKDRFRYIGDYYICGMEEKERKKSGRMQALAGIFQAAALVSAGMLNSPGTYKLYIVMPYLFMLLPLFYYILGSVKLIRVPDKMERYQYEESLLRQTKCAWALFLLNVFVIGGDGLFLVTALELEKRRSEAAFFLIMAALGSYNLIVLLSHIRRMKQVETVKQNT